MQTNFSDTSKGFHAAAATEPFDETQSESWQNGWLLWHQGPSKSQVQAPRRSFVCVH